MATTSGWQELTTNRKKQCPKLFYNYVTDENGYQLQFTDLIGLWTAKASAGDIRGYAKLTKTSIDPESTSQLRVLLQKLGQALAEGTNILKKEESSDSKAVLLETTLSLPRPLEPLEWQFHLEPQGAAEMAEQILRPCLYEASESSRKIEILIGTIEAKDRVISRLLEKIEGSSMDLSLIFPGITGARARKGQTSLSDAQRHVPGLREFKKNEWQESFSSDGGYASFEKAGLCRLEKGLADCKEHTKAQHDEWLHSLESGTTTHTMRQHTSLPREGRTDEHGHSDCNSDLLHPYPDNAMARRAPGLGRIGKAPKQNPPHLNQDGAFSSGSQLSAHPSGPIEVAEPDSETESVESSSDSDAGVPPPPLPLDEPKSKRGHGLGRIGKAPMQNPSRLNQDGASSSNPPPPMHSSDSIDAAGPDHDMQPADGKQAQVDRRRQELKRRIDATSAFKKRRKL